MDKTMSPSSFNPMTSGQMTKFYELLVAALRKSGLPSEPTQNVLESQGGVLADECVASLRKRVEAVSNMIVRHVKVNRTREPQAMLDATGRKQYTDRVVVKNMPRDGREEDDVFFFEPRKSAYDRYGNISDENLAKEYDFVGLKPDPYAQAQVNIDDPSFADECPNGTHWEDADGKWNFAAFPRWRGGGRDVRVDRRDSGWHGGWRFAGVRK